MTREDIVEFTRQAGGFDATPEFLERFASLVAAAEREACAKVCDDMEDKYWRSIKFEIEWTPVDCAAAIRARVQA
jgi:hypothetical protein